MSPARAAFDEYAEVVVDPDGRPTGALLEAGAMALVRQVVPRWTEAETLDAFAATLRAFNRVGLTGAHVMIGDPDLLRRRAGRSRHAATSPSAC